MCSGIRICRGEGGYSRPLADCLWSVITLADTYGVDLEAASSSTMRDLTEHLERT